MSSSKLRKILLVSLVVCWAALAAAENDEATELVAQGRAELESDQIEEAIATFTRATELHEGADAFLWLGRAYLEKLQSATMFDKLALSKNVVESFQKAVDLEPDNLEARSSLASFYFNAPPIAGGSFDKGMEHVEVIREADPKAGHLLTASAYASQNDVGKAKQEYGAVLELDDQDADAYYGLGILSQREEAWAEAYEAFAAAVESTGDLRSLYQIGRTGALSGQQLDRAQEALEQYIAQGPHAGGLPSVASAHWRLGMIYEHMDQKDLARSEYERALELESDMEQAKESLKNL